MSELPGYKVMVSARARYVRLRLSPDDGLTVVVPRGFDLALVPDIVASKFDWIMDASTRLHSRFPDRASRDLPASIDLLAIGESWTLALKPDAARRIRLNESRTGDFRTLTLIGGVSDTQAVAAKLQAWLEDKARLRLLPWLATLARQFDLPYASAAIRRQRTRWGSCTAKGHINLNRRLLLLPPPLCRLVLLHELCHTRHMNHSKDFWDLLASLEPQARTQDAALNRLGRYMPWWSV